MSGRNKYKRCCHCRKYLNTNKFGNSNFSKDGFYKACRECANEMNRVSYIKHKTSRRKAHRKHYDENKVKIRKRQAAYEKRNSKAINEKKKQYAQRHPKKRKSYQLRYNYWPNLTSKEALKAYYRMKREQDYKCAICPEKRKLVIDHCHKTGIVRGMLCMHCNHGLGSFRDSIDNLSSAIKYLEKTH